VEMWEQLKGLLLTGWGYRERDPSATFDAITDLTYSRRISPIHVSSCAPSPLVIILSFGKYATIRSIGSRCLSKGRTIPEFRAVVDEVAHLLGVSKDSVHR